MKNKLLYIVFFILAIAGCEEIYTPQLDEVNDFLVVEAIFVSNERQHEIYLYKTLGFNNESSIYPTVSGAEIFLVDEENNRFPFDETRPGKYAITHLLQEGQHYSIYIESNGEIYESDIQNVPQQPEVDTVYGEFTSKITADGVANSTDKLITSFGYQLYADIKQRGDLSHYRIFGRKTLQYYDSYDTLLPGMPEPERRIIYGWKTYYPSDAFNLAGPTKYSTEKDIVKHELEFFDQDYYKFIADTQYFAGWIYYIYQYGINEETYNYYQDLNSQLETEGKIFDPVYVQAEGNISCTSNPEVTVLGNFEISSLTEIRYFLDYRKAKQEITALKRIPYFYDIPERGFVKDVMPDFWEKKSKIYPND